MSRPPCVQRPRPEGVDKQEHGTVRCGIRKVSSGFQKYYTCAARPHHPFRLQVYKPFAKYQITTQTYLYKETPHPKAYIPEDPRGAAAVAGYLMKVYLPTKTSLLVLLGDTTDEWSDNLVVPPSNNPRARTTPLAHSTSGVVFMLDAARKGLGAPCGACDSVRPGVYHRPVGVKSGPMCPRPNSREGPRVLNPCGSRHEREQEPEQDEEGNDLHLSLRCCA